MSDRFVTIDDIIDVTAGLFAVTPAQLRGPSRRQPLLTARLAAMAVARQITGLSYPAIAWEFGGRDHTCAMNACRRRAVAPTVAQAADRILNAVRQMPVQINQWQLTIRCACGWAGTAALPAGAVASDLVRSQERLVAERAAHPCTVARTA